jgi:hypothetical protein
VSPWSERLGRWVDDWAESAHILPVALDPVPQWWADAWRAGVETGQVCRCSWAQDGPRDTTECAMHAGGEP